MITLNRPLDVDFEFETPQQLARTVADLIELHPHVLDHTFNSTACRLDGELQSYWKEGNVRFCALGTIRRVLYRDCTPSENGTFKDRLHSDVYRAVAERLPKGYRGDIGAWFEQTPVKAARFVKILRLAADDLEARPPLRFDGTPMYIRDAEGAAVGTF